MSASMTSATVRFRDALALSVAASAVLALLLPTSSLAATPGARTSAMTSLEESLIVAPDLDPVDTRQPVLGYLRMTEEGWQLNMLPGAVERTGPLPAITTNAGSALEDMTSQALVPSVNLLRVDF